MSKGLETASEWRLIYRRFIKHKLAVFGVLVLLLFYFIAILADFVAPYNPEIFFD